MLHELKLVQARLRVSYLLIALSTWSVIFKIVIITLNVILIVGVGVAAAISLIILETCRGDAMRVVEGRLILIVNHVLPNSVATIEQLLEVEPWRAMMGGMR